MPYPTMTSEELAEARKELDAREDERIRLRGEQLDQLQGTQRVLSDVEWERDDQNVKWGGAAHDDQHGPRDWAAFITEHLGKALDSAETHAFRSGYDRDTYRRRMIQVAALAVAAVETADRKQAEANAEAHPPKNIS